MSFPTLAIAALAVAAPLPSPPVPCGACLALHVAARQARLILSLGAPLQGLEVLVAFGDDWPPAEGTGVLDELAAAGARVGVITGPDAKADAELTRRVQTFLLDVTVVPFDAELAFRLKSSATTLRGAGALRIGLRLTAAQRAEAAVQGLAPYFDFVLIPGAGEPPAASDPFATTERWTAWPAGAPLDAMHALTLASEHGAARTLIDLPAGDEPLVPILAALAAAVPSGLAPLPAVAIRCDEPCDVESYLDASTLDAVVLVRPRAAISALTVQPSAAEITAVVPAFALHVAPPGAGPPWRFSVKSPRMSLPKVSSPFVLRVRGWQGGRAEEAFATGVEVRGQRTLSVEEVIVRHQAARARQASLLGASISTGTTVLTFDAPGFSAPVTVTAATTIYTSGASTEVEQRDIRVNGLQLTTRGDEVPKLPLIEPERVSTPPLVITLSDAYRYRLEGLETWRGRPTYVVAFQPVASGQSLFAGRAWIDGATFGLARLDATQTALPGPVVTSRQVDDFKAVSGAGEMLWLPSRSEIHQRYETASYATPIHRVLTLVTHLVNPEDFALRLEAARRSDAVMLKDTPAGFRYLRRARAAGSGAGATPAGGGEGATATRVVDEGRSERVRTVAGGVTWDPNITVPLVFGGVSYLDFNLFGSGAQIDGFFGGTYGRLAWSGPPIGRSGWRASGDAFGIAFSYNERMFRNGVEQYAENVTQRPFHLAGGVVGPLTGAWRMRAAYELDYVRYGRSESTAQNFVVPASTPVHGVRVTIERQRGPWVFAGWWNAAVRQRWGSWGLPGRGEPVTRSFQRVGLRASRSFVWSPRAVGRLEVAWMDGRGLDRFSRYGFGSFDNPLRGYPSASVRYARGLVFRSSASWTVASRLRLDGFADVGVVRDPGHSRRPQAFPGIGAGAQVPAPLGLLAAVEWGYGFAGFNTSGTKGTQVVKIMVYKVF